MSVVRLHNFSEKISGELKKLKQWPAIQSFFKALDQKNRLCWISGGAVRDLFLSRAPQDIDLTTDATEEEILELFPQAILVGREFGVYKIPIEGEVYDLTVFREERDYQDGRRPTEIYRSSPQKDAERRDFTINALFWDLKNEVLVDSVGGVADLEKGQIRSVGAAHLRFQEDHLRILRMVRLSYQLDFKIEVETYRAGLELVDALQRISGERILNELTKLKKLDQRLQFYKDELTQLIMKHNNLTFTDSVTKLKSLEKSGGDFKSVELQILTEILFLMDINLLHVEQIQRRLKISKEAKQWLIRCCEVQSSLERKISAAEMCLMLDRSEDYLKILNYFSSINLTLTSVAQHVSSLHKKFFQPLLSAQDIIPFVSAQRISKVLSHVRLLQFEGKITDQEAALEYVKTLDVRQGENG